MTTAAPADTGEWVVPASFGQERIWLACQLDPASPAYNIIVPVPLPYDIDAGAIIAALGEVVRRHEALRTSLRSEDGSLFQVVHATVPVDVPITDLSGLEPDEVHRRARELSLADFRTPIRPDGVPLWRARLIRLDSRDRWQLTVVVHHSIFDAGSVLLLSSELEELCQAALDGRPPKLPELDIQYADYSAWQREQLSGAALAEEMSFWRSRLSGMPPVHSVPTDRIRPAKPTDNGAEVVFPVSAELRGAVDELARQLRATPFMVLLTAFTALLSRTSCVDDVVVGVPVAGRDTTQLDPLLGMFVNTVVVRTDTSGDPTFTDLVGRIRSNLLECWEHQRTPFQKVVEEVAPARDPSVAPLCQIEFNYLPDLGFTDTFGVVHDELSLDMRDNAGRLSYRTDLFDEATARALTERYVRLLTAAVEAPATRLADLPLIGADERRQVVHDWNATERDFPVEATLASLVEAQVGRTPDAPALTFEGRSLSYAELDGRANQVAHRLRRLGVGPETLVGVCAERSFDLLVGVLGVVKAGGAYVPLDPEYPADRLAFMVADAAAPVVLTQRRLLDRLPATDAAILLLDHDDGVQATQADHGDWASESVEAPSPLAGPGNIAYAIYTSGSTGRPKGVPNTHRGIVNRLDWMQRTYGLTSGDVVLQKTPASFDVSVWELFWPLIAGARMVLARPGGHRDPAYLRQLIVSEQVSVIHFVPSMLAVFVADDAVSSCSSLRLVVASGEALPVAVAQRTLRQLPGAELHNLYGPTEAAVDVSSWRCTPSALAAATSVPIGAPIQNMRLYVLDARLDPVPVGVRGELYLAGVGLARGYLNRPALTAETFLPDPFGRSGDRMYRTGDVARWRPDGTVEFLGRIDHQVKIRGLRVELGEIEAALVAQPGVREAVVVIRGDGIGDGTLVAYVQGDPDVPSLRAALKRALPDYMVPAAYVVVDAFPLSPNGKLDRAALPPPDSGAAAAPETAYVAPRTASEELVASIWAEVLGRDRIGVFDDFFDLGGHSLLAMRVVSRISAALGLELPIHTFFENPTVDRLAGAVEDVLAAELAEISEDEAQRLLAADWN